MFKPNQKLKVVQNHKLFPEHVGYFQEIVNNFVVLSEIAPGEKKRYDAVKYFCVKKEDVVVDSV
jgi:hypothetical protein